MRLYLTLLIIFCAATQFANAQTIPADLKFDQRPVKCDKKWVAFPAKQGETRYGYGFVYFDEKAGFTFDFKGFFSIDNTGSFVVDTSATKTGLFKYRLSPDMPNVALIPARHFAEMHVAATPAWLSNYVYGYTDTLAHKYRLGYFYNVAGDCAEALIYLEPIYKMNPNYQGVIFELAFAYNDLKQSDKAIGILSAALKKDDKNSRLYRELGFAYMQKSDMPQAIKIYKQGIDLATNADDKSEMAVNLAMIYKNTNNPDEYKNWMIKAKSFTTPNSRLYNAITSQGF